MQAGCGLEKNEAVRNEGFVVVGFMGVSLLACPDLLTPMCKSYGQ